MTVHMICSLINQVHKLSVATKGPQGEGIVYSFVMMYHLTHWDRDKMADISQTTFFLSIFLNENLWISIDIWQTCIPKGRINNIPSLV